jgi:MFS family permease
MLLEYMDVSVLNTSLPQIAFSLHVNPINLKVALTVYLLTFGAFIPAASWFADRFGVKQVLLVAISGFLLSSIACGLSINLLTLTLARAAQGIFAAFITPVARILIINIIKEIYNILTSGGKLVVSDNAWSNYSCYPHNSIFDKVICYFKEFYIAHNLLHSKLQKFLLRCPNHRVVH